MKLIPAVLSAVGCQATPADYKHVDLDAGPRITWTTGCSDYGCNISEERLPEGPKFFKVLWCCPFLDIARGTVILRGSNNDPWISTSIEYPCGSTTTFLVSDSFVSIDAAMQARTRPEIANQCNLKR